MVRYCSLAEWARRMSGFPLTPHHQVPTAFDHARAGPQDPRHGRLPSRRSLHAAVGCSRCQPLPAEEAGFRYQVAFDPNRLPSVTIAAQAASRGSALGIAGDLGMGVSWGGPYDARLAFTLNDTELNMLRVKEHAGDAKVVERVDRPSDCVSDTRDRCDDSRGSGGPITAPTMGACRV